MRLIDADELKERIVIECRRIGKESKFVPPTLAFVKVIDNAPTVKTYTLADIEENYRKGLEKGLSEWEAERPTGEWEDFAKFVANEVLDDYFDYNAEAFAELACRRLVELGLVELHDGYYRMKGEEE